MFIDEPVPLAASRQGVAPETSTDAARILPEPPTGVQQERVDPYTLQIIEQLFPSHKGLTFLAALLCHAQVKQLALPGLGLPEVMDVAVIQMQSIRELSKKIGWGYDTTDKYVVLFCQLQLLYKQRQRTHICLHFPLSRVSLPSPNVLDQLQNYRPKVVQFAGRVKRRFQCMCKNILPSALLTPDIPTLDLPGILTDIKQILTTKKVDFDQQQQLLTEIQAALYRRCTSTLLKGDSAKQQETFVSETCRNPSCSDHQKDSLSKQIEPKRRLLYQQGDSCTVPLQKSASGVFKETPVATPTGQIGKLPEKKGDSTITLVANKGRLSDQKEDSSLDAHAQKSPMIPKKGDISPGHAFQKKRLSQQKEDFELAVQSQDRRLLDQKGDSELVTSENGRLVSQKGDSKHNRYADIALPNVNVITLLESITSDVNVLSLLCCKIFQEPASRRGVYTKIFRDDCQHDVQAITAAFIYVMVHLEDGSITKPAALFLARCRQWHQHRVPEEAAALVAQYGHLSYPQFIEVLRAPKRLPVSSAGDLVSAKQAGHATPLSLKKDSVLKPLIALRPTGGMHREEALHVYQQVRMDLRLGACRKQLVPLSDHTTFAVLIDNTITDRIHQVAIYSSEEWQKRSAMLRGCFDVFREME
jgi:hypothetical protein